MIHSVKFRAVLDTNVIFPVFKRDLLFWFAHYDLYTPKWSQNIFDEWKAVMIRKGVSAEEAQRRINKANEAFPDALVTGYELLIHQLQLPDKNDLHVLAAAIRANADVIVTDNLRDFPQDCIDEFDLEVRTTDDFLTDIIDLNHDIAVEAFRDLVLHKRNPPMDEYGVLNGLRKVGLKNTADFLHSLI